MEPMQIKHNFNYIKSHFCKENKNQKSVKSIFELKMYINCNKTCNNVLYCDQSLIYLYNVIFNINKSILISNCLSFVGYNKNFFYNYVYLLNIEGNNKLFHKDDCYLNSIFIGLVNDLKFSCLSSSNKDLINNTFCYYNDNVSKLTYDYSFMSNNITTINKSLLYTKSNYASSKSLSVLSWLFNDIIIKYYIQPKINIQKRFNNLINVKNNNYLYLKENLKKLYEFCDDTKIKYSCSINTRICIENNLLYMCKKNKKRLYDISKCKLTSNNIIRLNFFNIKHQRKTFPYTYCNKINTNIKNNYFTCIYNKSNKINIINKKKKYDNYKSKRQLIALYDLDVSDAENYKGLIDSINNHNSSAKKAKNSKLNNKNNSNNNSKTSRKEFLFNYLQIEKNNDFKLTNFNDVKSNNSKIKRNCSYDKKNSIKKYCDKLNIFKEETDKENKKFNVSNTTNNYINYNINLKSFENLNNISSILKKINNYKIKKSVIDSKTTIKSNNDCIIDEYLNFNYNDKKSLEKDTIDIDNNQLINLKQLNNEEINNINKFDIDNKLKEIKCLVSTNNNVIDFKVFCKIFSSKKNNMLLQNNNKDNNNNLFLLKYHNKLFFDLIKTYKGNCFFQKVFVNYILTNKYNYSKNIIEEGSGVVSEEVAKIIYKECLNNFMSLFLHPNANFFIQIIYGCFNYTDKLKLINIIINNLDFITNNIIAFNALISLIETQLEGKFEDILIDSIKSKYFNNNNKTTITDVRVYRLAEAFLYLLLKDQRKIKKIYFIVNFILENIRCLIDNRYGYFLVRKLCKIIKDNSIQSIIIDKIIKDIDMYANNVKGSLIIQCIIINFSMLESPLKKTIVTENSKEFFIINLHENITKKMDNFYNCNKTNKKSINTSEHKINDKYFSNKIKYNYSNCNLIKLYKVVICYILPRYYNKNCYKLLLCALNNSSNIFMDLLFSKLTEHVNYSFNDKEYFIESINANIINSLLIKLLQNIKSHIFLKDFCTRLMPKENNLIRDILIYVNNNFCNMLNLPVINDLVDLLNSVNNQKTYDKINYNNNNNNNNNFLYKDQNSLIDNNNNNDITNSSIADENILFSNINYNINMINNQNNKLKQSKKNYCNSNLININQLKNLYNNPIYNSSYNISQNVLNQNADVYRSHKVINNMRNNIYSDNFCNYNNLGNIHNNNIDSNNYYNNLNNLRINYNNYNNIPNQNAGLNSMNNKYSNNSYLRMDNCLNAINNNPNNIVFKNMNNANNCKYSNKNNYINYDFNNNYVNNLNNNNNNANYNYKYNSDNFISNNQLYSFNNNFK